MIHLTPFRRCPECQEPIHPGIDHYCDADDLHRVPRGIFYGALAALVLWLLILAAVKCSA